ncbi:hypothetical protein G6F57_007340 [Rhizopus arrhizus]|uniref:C2H2-type domain-containing protein n=1 Tax=Rhizopus oryzae TaxID=64495 RepID=A0A9P6X2Z8_RHIOR|nr:hypothetical protein G6F23_009723 [Rhizopus arrhizus]KAG1416053.1 hypothetical protein G6F58_006165 [Rhizopus delemar]KAG0784271.1 hypothetical protein G6F22_008376 [Rhizopus arrhizus]KAG0788627.1 hypothetical protein G6F21_007082 [Rhizopus arrhizus]KAG0807919.1 hypothetical protein G6F20_009989 [Rhizopus arrhizus]
MSSDNSMDYSDEEMVVHHLPTPTSPVEAHLFSQFTVKTPSESVFICPDCNHTFHRAHNLKSHQATHSTTKPFQCTDCEKQFLRLHDLKRHQKLHTGEKPYQCSNCLRSFSRLDALNRHKKTETACLKSNQLKPLMIPNPVLLEPAAQPMPSASQHIKLPSLMIHENADEVERLKQRVHDLEIENRVLRSLIRQDETQT